MATQGIAGLFGPMMTQEQLDEQRALEFAKLAPTQQRSLLIGKGAAGVGRSLAGMFGVDIQDPQLRRANKLRQLASQFDINTPEGLRQMATAVRQEDPQASMELARMAQAMELEKAKLGSEQALTAQRMRERQAASVEDKVFIELAKKATPESVKRAQEAGNNIGMLEIPEGEKLSTYGRVLVDAGLKPGTPEFQQRMGKFAEAELAGAATRGTTKVDVTLPGVQKAGDVTGLRKDIQAITKPYQDQADAAKDAIDLANMAIKNNNFAAVSSLSRSLAKAAGETQLSGRDVEAFGIDPSLVGRVADTVSRLAQSRPTVDTLTKLRQLAEALQKKAQSRIDLEEDQTREVARASGQFTEAQINTVFRRRPDQGKTKSFKTVEEAEAANLPKGTEILINGRRAVVE